MEGIPHSFTQGSFPLLAHVQAEQTMGVPAVKKDFAHTTNWQLTVAVSGNLPGTRLQGLEVPGEDGSQFLS